MSERRLAEERELDRDILGVLRGGARAVLGSTLVHDLALRLARHQFGYCAPLRAYWQSVGFNPQRATSWRDIPPVPSALFKMARVATFPEEETVAAYRSSGTTGSVRSAHALNSLELYRVAAVETFRAFALPDVPSLDLLALVESPVDAPDSSLSAMVGFIAEAMPQGSSVQWLAARGRVDVERAWASLVAAHDAGAPVLVFGTAFSFVHLCDALLGSRRSIVLPRGSRVVETGGYKGRSRELSRAELLDLIGQCLGLSPACVVNEYGMSELSSQFYSTSLLARDARGIGAWSGPPWLLARALDPQTGHDVSPGTPGVLAFVDLANRGSAVALATADMGCVFPDGSLDVWGRAKRVEVRGCSLAFDLGAMHVDAMFGGAGTAAADTSELGDGSDVAPLDLAEAFRVASVLEQVAQSWLEPASKWRSGASVEVAAECGLSEAVVDAGIMASFAPWLDGAWAAVVERELATAHGAWRPALVAVLAAGNVPTPVAWDIAAALLVGARVRVRPSSRCRAFVGWFVRSLAAVDQGLGAAIELVPPGEGSGEVHGSPWWWQGASAAIVNGSDATVRAVCSAFPRGLPHLARGSRYSVALVGQVESSRRLVQHTAELLARDVALWDQRGCLSPCVAIVQGSDGAVALAQEVERALERLSRDWPCGRDELDAEIATGEARATAIAAFAAGASPFAGTWAAVWPDSSRIIPVSGRFIAVLPSDDLSRPPAAVVGLGARLSTVAVAAKASNTQDILRGWARLGASRYCSLGRCQAPPVAWHHDGAESLRSLLRFIDCHE